jgi:hypothetical protein
MSAVKPRLGGGTIALAVAAAGLATLAAGCAKDKESLLLVDLHATDMNGASVATVQISVGKPAPSTDVVISPIFDLPSTGLPMSVIVEYGVFLPAGVTGTVPVTAIAKPVTGCMGYRGTGLVTVNAGGTAKIAITMMFSSDVCGGGGACGTGVGNKPATVAPPTLSNCVEHDSQMGVTCDPVGDVNNPWINMVAVSPDGSLLATASEDSYHNGSVKIWRLQGNTPTPCGPVFTGPLVGPGYIAFSPNGQLFAVAWTQRYVDVYTVPSFSFMGEIQSSPNPLYGVGFSHDSQTVLSVDWDGNVDGTIYADHPDGTAIASIAIGADPDALAVSPVAIGGGTAIVVPGYSGNFAYHTWTGTSFGTPVVLPTVAGLAGTRAAFSPNGMLMAESTEDGSVRFWNLPITATSVPTGAGIMLADVPLGLAFSPGSDFVSFAYGTTFDIWNVSTRTRASQHLVNGTFADSVTFSASGGALIGGEDRCGKFLVCQ